MTNEVLPRAAGAEYLADVLRRAGVMGDGRLCNVEVDSSRRQLVSRIIRLQRQGRPILPHPQDRRPHASR
jgi:hypothetical protein